MRFLLWSCGAAALLGLSGSGLSQPSTIATFAGHVLAGVATFLVFGWLAESLSAIRRAADALEEITDQGPSKADDEKPSYHRSGADILLGRKK